jgi:hypothetical protein
MKKYREPKCMRELRAIRDQIYKEAKAIGFARYYADLNKKSGWLLAQGKKTPPSSVRERSAKYRVR